MLAVLLLALLPCAYSLGVIAPLYYDPGSGCSGWSPISSAISANTGTSFYLIINPDSGPGVSGSLPDQSYNDCVPSLRPSSNPNTVVLGYIDIGSRSSAAVLADVDTYAGWSDSSRPTGIFFDESSTGSNVISTYQTFVSHAKSKGFIFIALDPGSTPDSGYYPFVDLINTYEDTYSSFGSSDLVISSAAPASKQTVILIDAPASGSYATVISELAALELAAVYITDLSDDTSGIPKQWSAFVSDIAAVIEPSLSSTASALSTTTSTSQSTQASGSSPSNSTTSPSAQASGKSSSGSTTASVIKTSSGSVTSSSGQTSTASPAAAATTSSSHVGAIVGGVLGGVAILILITSIILCRRRKRPSLGAPLDPFTSRNSSTFVQSNTNAKSNTYTDTDPSRTEPSTGEVLPPLMTVHSSPISDEQETPTSFEAPKEPLTLTYPGLTVRNVTSVALSSPSSGTSARQRFSLDPPPSYRDSTETV